MSKKPKTRDDHLDEIIEDLTRRLGALEKMAREINKRQIAIEQAFSLLRQPPQGRAGIQQQGYLAGQWHRRDGTVYGKVAAKGTPNAAEAPNNPTGPVPPAEQRGGGHEGTG